MGGGNESAFGDECEEEKLLSPAEQEEASSGEEEARKQTANSAPSSAQAPPLPSLQEFLSSSKASCGEEEARKQTANWANWMASSAKAPPSPSLQKILSSADASWGEEEARKRSWLAKNWAAGFLNAQPPPPQEEVFNSAESSTSKASRIKPSTSSATSMTLLPDSSKAAAGQQVTTMPRTKSGKNSLGRLRNKLLAYLPGSFLGSKVDKFKIPDVTSLLVVGLRGSGKSAVINRIIRVLEGEGAEFYRAPLSGSHDQCGTYFVTEYPICNSNVSLFDTRGFTESEVAQGMSVPEEWMTQGVRDGQMELRPGDAKYLREEVKLRGRHVDHMLSKRREVNFVIFVVNAAHFMERKKHGDKGALAKLKTLYENPFFSFRDDRPVLVMTHTDELSVYDTVLAPSVLAEHFKVPALEHVYDLSGAPSQNSVGDEENAIVRDKATLEMLMTALQRADRHLPQKRSVMHSLFHIYDCYVDYARYSEPLMFHVKIIAVFLLFLSFMYFCAVVLRTHRSLTQWIEQLADGKTVTINLRWLGKKIRF